MPRLAPVAVLCAALLAGCNSGKQPDLATQAALSLGRDFISGTCQSVLELTEDSRSHNERTRRTWIDGCEQIRAVAVASRGINIDSVRLLPGDPVAFLVVSEVVTGHGTYRIESYWHLNQSRADLYALELEGNGKRISIPPLPPAERKLMDPPPTPRSTPPNTSLGPTVRRATGNERPPTLPNAAAHRSSAARTARCRRGPASRRAPAAWCRCPSRRRRA